MEYLTNPLVIAGGVTAIFVVIGTVYEVSDLGQEDENLKIEWKRSWDYDHVEESPPEPLFNKLDNEDCVSKVEGFYAEAVLAQEDLVEKNEQLVESYEEILDLQDQIGGSLELVNNHRFLDWIISDWDQTWKAQNTNSTAPVPYDDYMIQQKFISAPNGSGRKNLRTTDDVDSAIDALFWFRAYAGLEDYSYEYEIDPMDWKDYEYFECSQNTQELASVYTSFISYRDVRHLNYYPLLDRIVDWM